MVGKKKVWIGIVVLIIILAVLYLIFNRNGVTGGVISSPSPSACSGQWSNCAYAFSDDTSRASVGVKSGITKSGIWNNYGFSVPTGASIDRVMVRSDFFASRNTGFIDVQVSGDGGASFGPAHRVGGNTAEQTFSIDVTNDVAWNPAKLNNANLQVKATCLKVGGGSNPTCRLDWIPIMVNYTEFDFSVSVSPSSGSVVRGGSSLTSVNVNLLGGTSQPVTLYHSQCPTGATCSFSPESGNPSYSSTFSVVTSEATPAGNYTITIAGTGNDMTRSNIYILTVDNVDSSPVASASANPSSGAAPLSVGFTGSVSGGNAPFTYSWDFGDSTTSSEQNSTHSYGTAGTYQAVFTVTDADGDVSNDNVTITVTAAPSFNFNVSLSPSSKSIVQGNSTTTSATISLVSGTTQSVSLSQSGCPTGATCTFSTSSGNPTYSSTMTVATTSSTPVGTYPITITGTGGGLTRTATFTLTVTAPLSFNFSVSLSSSSGNTSRGGSVSSTAFVTLRSGTTQSVSLSQSGCPTGTTCTFNSSSGNPSFSSRFTVSTTNSTPTGVHNIIVSGTGGGLTRSGYYTLTVNP